MRLPARSIELIGAITLVAAQTGSTAAQGAERDTASWQLGLRFTVPVRYDDNPFRLDRENKRRLSFLSRDDARSGRFAHMESSDDVIPVPKLEVDLEGPGFAGRKLELEAEVGYYANLFNARRHHVQLEFEIALSGPDSRLRLISEWRPRYFPHNYLSDAIDDDADGEITTHERRYKAARSRQMEVALLYRHRLVRQHTRPIDVLVEFDRAIPGPLMPRHSPHGSAPDCKRWPSSPSKARDGRWNWSTASSACWMNRIARS